MAVQQSFTSVLVLVVLTTPVYAGVGDPQVKTDHPWYPGELAISTFPRLFETQAAVYRRVVGRSPVTDEQRALASWLWRNTHYWHGEPGGEDLWGEGFSNRSDSVTREYWTGLFAHGFGLCGTTHAQWTAEMEYLLGHNRARVLGVTGHNSFEVFLTGGAYAQGRWALLDHDVSTVIFDDQGRRLLSIAEIQANVQHWTARRGADAKQRGWLICGLHPDDGAAFDSYRTAEYLAGYAGAPPMVHLRRGESLRRYLQPGLEDGRTFVFWGRNYNIGGIPGPERSRTWVNQPDEMYGSTGGTPHRDGQARYANAVYVYRPNFANGDYREGIVDQSNQHVTFEFQSPYVIAATPASDEAWGIYQPGCRNGLKVDGRGGVAVSRSTDRGRNWKRVGSLDGPRDLTDHVKGQRQYGLRLHRSAERLVESELQIPTVCQAHASFLPRLTENGSQVEFQASGRAVVSAGPTIAQAETHRIAGQFDTPRVSLQLAAPRNAAAIEILAAAHVASSNPPSPEVTYQIDFSTDQGRSWEPLVRDWRITRQGQEPDDFWSQSFCWGNVAINGTSDPVQVRFRNDGGKRYRRAEMHLVYRVPNQDATRVTFHWQDDQGRHTQAQVFQSDGPGSTWEIPTGTNVQTRWVEYQPIASKAPE